MRKPHVKIKIFSDTEDVSSINSAMKQLELKNLSISPSFPQRFTAGDDEIIILQINNIESKYLNRIIKVKNDIRNKIIFLIPENNALLVSSIAKLGFLDIFVLPYELYMFISYVEEILVNNAYLTSTKNSEGYGDDIYDFSSIIGNSIELLRTINLARKVAEKTDVNVLIRGETGTGKGLIARAIHKNSKSFTGPFVDIVCSSIPENLLESELFGYEPGAFTNAKTRKIGLFELAENGTLFLDEIGDLSINIQKKLLRAIEKKLIRRLGGLTDIPINARIISATNMNLEELIENNIFRRDLYHRLNVVTLEMPPVRKRDGDALILAKQFIKEFNQQFGKSITKINNEAKEFITSYPWPGNVREIRNAIERAVLLTESPTIKYKDLSHILISHLPIQIKSEDETTFLPHQIKLDLNFNQTNIKSLEQIYAREVLNKTKGNKSRTARLLGISRPKLNSLLN